MFPYFLFPTILNRLNFSSKILICFHQVRLAVLNVIDKIYDSLGESYMVLIPEAIPYLSEVLEGNQCLKSVHDKCALSKKRVYTLVVNRL